MAETRRFIGKILEETRGVAAEQIDKALENQIHGDERKIGEILIANNACTEEDVTAALSEQFGIEMVHLDGADISDAALGLMTADECRTHGAIPLDMYNSVLTIAISDPLNLTALNMIRNIAKLQIEPVLAPAAAIAAEIEKHYPRKNDGETSSTGK